MKSFVGTIRAVIFAKVCQMEMPGGSDNREVFGLLFLLIGLKVGV